MLDKLKKAGNPYYQFHDDLNTYEERCKESDPDGHEVVFPKHDDLEEDMGGMLIAGMTVVDDEIIENKELDSDDDSDGDDSDDDSNDESKEEKEYITKDPVRKY